VSERLLIAGGTVRPLDGRSASAEALVVRDGRVEALGTRDEMSSLAGRDARAIDVEGATVMPGLIDTHPHLMHFGALARPLVDCFDASSHDEIVARIGARAAATEPGEWVMASPVGEPHYFIRRSWRDLREGALPDRHVLDRATAEHPVWVQAWAPVTPNVTAFNSPGLERIGITRDTPDRVGKVTIEKDASGEPTGILRGSSTTTTTTSRSGTGSSPSCRSSAPRTCSRAPAARCATTTLSESRPSTKGTRWATRRWTRTARCASSGG
jgi:predicted amidohydrolase YtcJ